MSDQSRPDSALFDYIVNGGDDLALAHASIEHIGGVLGREIELHTQTRELAAGLLAALENARRDLLSVCPQRGSPSPKRLIILNAVARIEAAIAKANSQ